MEIFESVLNSNIRNVQNVQNAKIVSQKRIRVKFQA